MPAALPLLEIGLLLVALLAIALAQQINNIMRAVGDLVRDVWLVGGAIADGVDAVARGISYVLGKAERGVDSAIGASWHALARLTDGIWRQIEETALGYLHLVQLVADLVYAHSGLKSLVGHLSHTYHGIEHGVKDLRREWRGIDHRVNRLERELTRGIGHDLHIGLRDLTTEVHGVEKKIAGTIQPEIDYAEGLTKSLRDFIKAIPGTKYTDWVAGIVAAGLAAIGMDWLICRTRKNVNGKSGCNLWDDIEGLLGLATAAFAFANFEELMKVAEEVEPEVISVAKDILGLG